MVANTKILHGWVDEFLVVSKLVDGLVLHISATHWRRTNILTDIAQVA